MSDRVEKFIEIGRRLDAAFPKNEGALTSFSDFVEFCEEVGRTGHTLASVIGKDAKPPFKAKVLKSGPSEPKPENG